MLDGAILSGAVSAILGALSAITLDHFWNDFKSRAEMLRAMYVELYENRRRLEDEIRRIQSDDWPRILEHRYQADILELMTQRCPSLYARIASGNGEIVRSYRVLDDLNITYEASRAPDATIKGDQEEYAEHLQLYHSYLEISIESVKRIWGENRLRTLLFEESLSDHHGGYRFARVPDELVEDLDDEEFEEEITK